MFHQAGVSIDAVEPDASTPKKVSSGSVPWSER
jgi:hypothetical protein